MLWLPEEVRFGLAGVLPPLLLERRGDCGLLLGVSLELLFPSDPAFDDKMEKKKEKRKKNRKGEQITVNSDLY